MNPEQATDAVIAAIAHKTAQGGALATVVGWAASSQGTAFIGIVIGLIGLGVQFYYRRKQDKREEAEHQARMGLLE
jgi:hypothetical protein